jgi:tetratricopeptide (TPR) repeat protein
MSNVLQFPSEAARRPAFQAVRSSYSLREIARQFGLSETLIRRWTREGLIPATAIASGDLRYDFSALKRFRRVREMRAQGMSLDQIALELRGQLNLFPESQSELISLPIRVTPFEEALLLYDAGDPRAAEVFEKAIAAGDCVADAYCNLGILSFVGGRMDEAFDYLTRSLKEDPRHFESHYNLANLYLEIGDHRLAREHYELAAALEPSFPNLYFNLGLTQALGGDLQAALAALRKYCELVTEDERATCLDLISHLERAVASRAGAVPAQKSS